MSVSSHFYTLKSRTKVSCYFSCLHEHNHVVGWDSEKAMAPHSSTLAWKIPWTEEPGGLQSMGSLRVGHDWATSLSLSCIGEGNGNPLQCSCLENPRDGGAWWATVYGVAQSWTRLKRLSSSSSSRQSLLEKILCAYKKSQNVQICSLWTLLCKEIMLL